MEKITGFIESREVKDIQGKGKFAGQTNQKIALTIEGKTYSAFDNAVPADVAERLGAIKAGDEVELTYEAKEGSWQGKPTTYRNIKDIVRVDRLDKGVAPSAQAEKSVAQKTDSRDHMMRTSYIKDLMIAFPDLDEDALMEKVATLKRLALALGE